MVLLWAQLTAREGIRDIVGSLSAHQSKFYHLGFGKSVCRTTLADANEKRRVEIYKLFSERMVKIAQDKRVVLEDLFIDGIAYRVFAIDSTTITFDLEKFSWSKSQHGKGGVKVHTLFDILTKIPICNIITDHSVRDQSMMDNFEYESDAFYVFDKAYMKLLSLSNIDQQNGYFVIRRKQKMNFEIIEEYDCSKRIDGVLGDFKIKLSGRWAKTRYKKPLRIVYYHDEDKDINLELFTNNLELDAYKIAELYKYRWQIELFFKWVKQHLRIKQFYGISENAVLIQIYVAIIAYCVVALVATEYKLKMSPFELLRILSVSMFEKVNLREFLLIADYGDNLQFESSRYPTLF